ncbi:MAG: magnesium/cobalt transporter CorA [Spirochaetia bacterium]
MAAESQESKWYGLPPGTVIPDKFKGSPVQIRSIEYDEHSVREEQKNVLLTHKDVETGKPVQWLDIIGVENGPFLEKIGKLFSIHPLVLEDIQNTGQRPKFEDYGDLIYIIFKMLDWDNVENTVISEQVSLILNKTHVLSFQERSGDIFDVIRNRIKTGSGRIRKKKSDYLAYSLLDAVVDHYFLVLEKLEDEFEDIEDELVLNPQREIIGRINNLKRQINVLRRAVWPLREVTGVFMKRESVLVEEETAVFISDLYDHVIQIIDTLDSFREMSSSLIDLYHSHLTTNMNQVMKVLTVIATIFIPLTFITGIYGMNFKYMPELDFPWAYPLILGVMIMVSIGMIIFFKRKKWL